ncbi:ANTAR domain-containing protein [Streptomyces sp. NPDC090106]|uniref:ANTAR domain-containing protein n=1 Tax=Streptomyces sp. NPDC090106 TaxID=3365946 RepID=UPI00381BC293
MSDHLTALPGGQKCTDCGAPWRSASPFPRLSLTVHTGPHGRHALVTASGEIDFDSSHTLLRTLEDALEQSADGLEVDLARISFCDCSGLNALLLIRRRASETAKTLTVRVSSPAVQHLLELTGTLDTLTAPDPEQGAAPADDAVRTENDQLRRAMQTRPAIDIARGILMASYTLSAEQAWNVLVSTSQNSNIKLHLLAEALLDTVHGQNLPQPLVGHLAKAVKEHAA